MKLNEDQVAPPFRSLVFKHSRLEILKSYCLLNLLFFIAASVMIPIKMIGLSYIGIAMGMVSYFFLVCNIFLLLVNVYFKLNK